MRANQFIKELSYPGNIGMMELIKFQKVATPEEKIRMKFLLSTDKKAAWDLLQQVTGTELQPLEEQSLYEIDMSPSNLRKLAADTGAVAGMEFEMVVPDTESDEEPELEPDFSSDDRVSSFQGIEDFFADGDWNSRSDVRRFIERMQEDYYEWASEKQVELWQDEKDDFFREEMGDEFDFDEAQESAAEELGLDPDSDEVKERVREMFDEFVDNEWDRQGSLYQNAYDNWVDSASLPDESDFFDYQGYKWMSDVYNNYSGSIAWPYYTESGGGGQSIQDVGEMFSDMIGKGVNVSRSYHGARRDPNKYVLEPDGSIDGDNPGDRGLEFVSPPMPIDEMLSDLQKTIKWAKQQGAYTNSSTGLHMNISIPGKNVAFMDFVKLALLLGDNYVLEQFGREANNYTKSALEKIKGEVKYNPEMAQKLMDEMRKGLGAIASRAIASSDGFGKYTSINPKEGYVEFRSPGGDWLNEDIGKLTNTLLRFVVALDASMDTQAYRKEYLKKLYQLLQPKSNDDPIAIFAQYSAGMLPQSALKIFIKNIQTQRQYQKDQTANKPTGKYWWLVKQKDGAGSIEVVASNEQEAKARARASWGISAPDLSLDAKPLRPYDLDTPRNELNQQNIRQYEVYMVDGQDRVGVFTSTPENARNRFREFLRSRGQESPAGLGYRDIT
jgi:hypothetical protein